MKILSRSVPSIGARGGTGARACVVLPAHVGSGCVETAASTRCAWITTIAVKMGCSLGAVWGYSRDTSILKWIVPRPTSAEKPGNRHCKTESNQNKHDTCVIFGGGGGISFSEFPGHL